MCDVCGCDDNAPPEARVRALAAVLSSMRCLWLLLRCYFGYWHCSFARHVGVDRGGSGCGPL